MELGVRGSKKTSWPISTYFHPTFQKIKPDASIRSVVRDLTYPILCPYSLYTGRWAVDLEQYQVAEKQAKKNREFCKKRVSSMLANHRSDASDVKFEF